MTDKVIRGLECCFSRDIVCFKCPYNDGNRGCDPNELKSDVLALLKEHEAKPVKHIQEEFSEHEWEKKEDGEIDLFAFEEEFCNGPVCKRCGYCFCVHCNPDGYTKEPCNVDEYVCPSCGSRLRKYIKERFCHHCGQEVIWDD